MNDKAFKDVYERLIRLGIAKQNAYVSAPNASESLHDSAIKFARLYKKPASQTDLEQAAAELAAAIWICQSLNYIAESDAQRLIDDIYKLIEI